MYRGVWFCRDVGAEQLVEEEVAVKTLLVKRYAYNSLDNLFLATLW